MLGKLIKHEWKQCSHYFIPLYIGVAIASALSTIMIVINKVADNEILSSVTLPFGIGGFIVAMVCLMFGAVFVVAYRFYKSMVSEEGYLTHTLPVSMDQLLVSKTLTAILYNILSVVIALVFACIFVFFGFMLTDMIRGTFSVNDIATFYHSAMRVLKSVNISIGVIIVEMVVMTIVGSVGKLLMAYLSIAIGQCMKNHKLAWSIIYYACISFALGFVGQIIASLFMVIFGAAAGDWIQTHINMYFHAVFIGGSAIALVQVFVCYFITRHLLDKKLNLE